MKFTENKGGFVHFCTTLSNARRNGRFSRRSRLLASGQAPLGRFHGDRPSSGWPLAAGTRLQRGMGEGTIGRYARGAGAGPPAVQVAVTGRPATAGLASGRRSEAREEVRDVSGSKLIAMAAVLAASSAGRQATSAGRRGAEPRAVGRVRRGQDRLLRAQGPRA